MSSGQHAVVSPPSNNLSLSFVSVRTGLEAIMETYAFWRPPVRTLTFEDFTNMQKQQGWWTPHSHASCDLFFFFSHPIEEILNFVVWFVVMCAFYVCISKRSSAKKHIFKNFTFFKLYIFQISRDVEVKTLNIQLQLAQC